MKLVLSGTSYNAALSDVEPVLVKAKGYGVQVTLEAPDAATWESWVTLLAAAACDLVDAGKPAAAEQIYRDIERSDARMVT